MALPPISGNQAGYSLSNFPDVSSNSALRSSTLPAQSADSISLNAANALNPNRTIASDQFSSSKTASQMPSSGKQPNDAQADQEQKTPPRPISLGAQLAWGFVALAGGLGILLGVRFHEGKQAAKLALEGKAFLEHKIIGGIQKLDPYYHDMFHFNCTALPPELNMNDSLVKEASKVLAEENKAILDARELISRGTSGSDRALEKLPRFKKFLANKGKAAKKYQKAYFEIVDKMIENKQIVLFNNIFAKTKKPKPELVEKFKKEFAEKFEIYKEIIESQGYTVGDRVLNEEDKTCISASITKNEMS